MSRVFLFADNGEVIISTVEVPLSVIIEVVFDHFCSLYFYPFLTLNESSLASLKFFLVSKSFTSLAFLV